MSRQNKCSKCGQAMQVADWPFCPHGSTLKRNAMIASPTVVFQNKKGEYRLPGRDTDKPPRGYKKVSLSSQRARDRFEKEFGARENEKLRERLRSDKHAFEMNFAKSRPKLMALLENTRSEYTRRFVEVCFRDAERRQAKDVEHAAAGFMIESNHVDAQNRMPWQDKDTGWKPKR